MFGFLQSAFPIIIPIIIHQIKIFRTVPGFLRRDENLRQWRGYLYGGILPGAGYKTITQ